MDLLEQLLLELPESVAHATGRAAADTGRLLPGTPEYLAAFETVVNDPDLLQG